MDGCGYVPPLDQLDALEARVARGSRVDDPPAADSRARAEHEAVAAGGNGGRGKAQLRVPLADPPDRGRDLRGAVVDVHAGAVGDRLELLERDVQAVARRVRTGLDERVAAPQLRALDPRQADRDALTGLGDVDRAVVHLHAPHADIEAGRAPRAARRPRRSGPTRACPWRPSRSRGG